LNIIHIDTSILCGKDGEDGSLVLDMLLLRSALDGMDKTKPCIVIAHHPFDSLESMEQAQLELFLKEYNTILYLCGHKHFTRCRNIQVRQHNTNLWEFVCGTNMDNPPTAELAEICFFIGEIDTKSNCGYVESHKWSQRSNAWILDSDFSFPQNGANDGKFCFPSREVVLGKSCDNDRQIEMRDECHVSIKSECDKVQLVRKSKDKEKYTYFTDHRDGKKYKTTKIDNKIWMAENFNYSVPYSKYYINGEKYGRFYNLETAITICPIGWHLPTLSEWEDLVNFVGDYDTSGKKLKAQNGWFNYIDSNGKLQSGNGTDEFNFTALPGGLGDESNLYNLGHKCVWWSTTEVDSHMAYSRGIDSYGDYIFIGRDFKVNFLSVRYVKD
jgi:uncharacterized protein (TIGR02145 family)